ncbi:GNAT family N-acetyltransferase [Ornithinibacillus massiliensis]|uniref:GNAT family N-acetyltransferase n=1 Tax=Ornithinibacillus massiliensis TaxID=1944633 RepID=UPI001FE7F0A0|nr:GNAT family N-acetyltransferase [Ornithinibacillus massiliensis]
MLNKQVRLATVKDAIALSRLNHKFNGGEKIDPEIIKECLHAGNELVVVAVVNEQVVGFACAQSFQTFCYPSSVGEITEMYVEETARGMGLASSMISLLEKELLHRGIQSIKIITGKDNDRAIKTYQKSQYLLEDVVVLEKEL